MRTYTSARVPCAKGFLNCPDVRALFSHSHREMAINIELNSDRYVQLLGKLIGEAEHLQNNPPKFVPQEDRYGCGLGSLFVHVCEWGAQVCVCCRVGGW